MRRQLGDRNVSFVYNDNVKADITLDMTNGGFKKVDIVENELDKINPDKMFIFEKSYLIRIPLQLFGLIMLCFLIFD